LPILVNKNTTQTPMTVAGRTGTQLTRFIPAPRIYVKAPDPISPAPVQANFVVSNGTTIAGWTDLGIVSKGAKVVYDKKQKDILTGIDNYFRAAYVEQKTAKIEFDLEQFDDSNIELLTGYTGSVITSGSIVNYQIGEEDLVQKAILVVFQNKLDQKEFQFYNPNAYLNFVFKESTEGMVLSVTAMLPSFTPQGETKEAFLSTTIFKV
jgi:hypothetical protein